MSLSEVELVFFLPVVFALYWLGPRRINWQNAVLVVAGYLFYWTWSPKLVWVLLLATAVDYAVGFGMDRWRGDDRRLRLLLRLSVVYNVGQLAWFKYEGFFARSLNDLLGSVGMSPGLPVLQIALPLGLSYYTFQKLSYVVDVYYDRIPACRNPLTFAAFTSFFAQLTAGPIVRGGQLLPQLSVPRRLDPALLRSGAATFLVGFVGKAYIADWLAAWIVVPIFSEPAAYSAGMHWLALVGYCFQLFCDFAGYSVMAIGLGRFFGLELPVNFNFPFFSKNMMEFWRRWHITLNAWLFDYLYGPLTLGKGRLHGRLDLGFLVVFGISGLWHGAAWGFVLWGLLHGVGLVVQRRWDVFYRGLCRKDRKWVARRKTRAYGLAAWAITQTFFLLTLLPFRLPDLSKMLSFGAGMFTAVGTKAPPGLFALRDAVNLPIIVGLLVLYHLAGSKRGQRWVERFVRLPAPLRGVAWGVGVVFLALFVPVASGTFVYANF